MLAFGRTERTWTAVSGAIATTSATLYSVLPGVPKEIAGWVLVVSGVCVGIFGIRAAWMYEKNTTLEIRGSRADLDNFFMTKVKDAYPVERIEHRAEDRDEYRFSPGERQFMYHMMGRLREEFEEKEQQRGEHRLRSAWK